MDEAGISKRASLVDANGWSNKWSADAAPLPSGAPDALAEPCCASLVSVFGC